MNTLNQNIKILRTKAGFNQVDFARRMNVSKQCVSNWENDNIQPSIEMLERIADFFAVSTDYLLGRTATETIDVTPLTPEQRAHVRLIVKDLSNMSN